MTVGWDLNLSYTKIRALPKDLKVEGDLDLSYTNISILPDGLTLGGGLNLHHTPIKALPKGLTLGRHFLDLSDTEITAWPEDLIVIENEEIY